MPIFYERKDRKEITDYTDWNSTPFEPIETLEMHYPMFYIYQPYRWSPFVFPFLYLWSLAYVFNQQKLIGLAKSCSRFPEKLPEISQKVAQKLLFVTKVAQKLLQKAKTFFLSLSLLLFGLMQKYAICTTTVKFLSIFVQFCVVTSVAE